MCWGMKILGLQKKNRAQANNVVFVVHQLVHFDIAIQVITQLVVFVQKISKLSKWMLISKTSSLEKRSYPFCCSLWRFCTTEDSIFLRNFEWLLLLFVC